MGLYKLIYPKLGVKIGAGKTPPFYIPVVGGLSTMKISQLHSKKLTHLQKRLYSLLIFGFSYKWLVSVFSFVFFVLHLIASAKHIEKNFF